MYIREPVDRKSKIVAGFGRGDLCIQSVIFTDMSEAGIHFCLTSMNKGTNQKLKTPYPNWKILAVVRILDEWGTIYRTFHVVWQSLPRKKTDELNDELPIRLTSQMHPGSQKLMASIRTKNAECGNVVITLQLVLRNVFSMGHNCTNVLPSSSEDSWGNRKVQTISEWFTQVQETWITLYVLRGRITCHSESEVFNQTGHFFLENTKVSRLNVKQTMMISSQMWLHDM